MKWIVIFLTILFIYFVPVISKYEKVPGHNAQKLTHITIFKYATELNQKYTQE